MSKTVTVVFDGQVLRPETPLDLEPDKRYVITIETEPATVPTGDAWDVLEAFAGTVEAAPDWSIEHDHYLYGISTKRYSQTLKKLKREMPA